MLKFYIDGTEWQEQGNISGWESLRRTIQRTYQNGEGILITADGEIRFHGELYDYFYNEFITGTICNDYDMLILESRDGLTYTEFYKGKIFLSDFEFDADIKTARTTIQDNSYYSRINNNKSISTSPVTGLSKNSIAITPCTVWEAETFNCDTGAAYNHVQVIRIHDLLRYLVAFMSDDSIQFRSDVFDYGGQYEGAFVTTGQSLRTENFADVPFVVSWSEVISELYKNFNIGFEIEIDTTSLAPVLRVERQQDIYTDNIAHTFHNPMGLKLRYKKENNYAKVQIGSEITSEPQQTYLPFPETITLQGFQKAEYYLLGQCNIDSVLNLVRTWIVSSNIIFDINFHLEPGYDDNLVMLMCDTLNSGSHTAKAMRSNSLTAAATPLFYNEALYSAECLLRFYGSIPQSLVQNTGMLNQDFLATLNQTLNFTTLNANPPVQVNPVIFMNDSISPGYDTAGNYNTATGKYTVPSSGIYSFELNLDTLVSVPVSGSVLVYAGFIRRNSASVIVQTVNSPLNEFNTISSFPPVSWQITFGTTLGCDTGDTVEVVLNVYITHIYNTLEIRPESVFRSIERVVQTFDENQYKAILINFETDVTQEQIKTIMQNKKGKFAVVYDNVQHEGWLEKCIIHSSPGRQSAEVSLITSLNYIV